MGHYGLFGFFIGLAIVWGILGATLWAIWSFWGITLPLFWQGILASLLIIGGILLGVCWFFIMLIGAMMEG